jgi:hypothetical protein
MQVFAPPLFRFLLETPMALDYKSGTALTVKVSKAVMSESAVKTLERLFMKDRAISGPLEARSSNFKELPKRRGGCIWTKRPNKIFPSVDVGVTAHLAATPQVLRDLASVARYITVTAK